MKPITTSAILRFLLPTAAIAIASCVHHPPYPDSWPPIRSSIGADCSGLSGLYDAHYGGASNVSYSGNLPAELHWAVFGTKHDPVIWDPNKPTSVRLIVAAPKATATFLVGSAAIRTLEIGAPATPASCDGHELKLLRIAGAATLFSFGAGTESTWLLRDNDGSLIVRTGYNMGGLGMLVIPVADSHYEWIRYNEHQPMTVVSRQGTRSQGNERLHQSFLTDSRAPTQ